MPRIAAYSTKLCRYMYVEQQQSYCELNIVSCRVTARLPAMDNNAIYYYSAIHLSLFIRNTDRTCLWRGRETQFCCFRCV